MARRWTPKRIITLRRMRVILVVLAVVLASCVTFVCTARKTVALEVNGEHRTVTTYAPDVSSFLRQQNVPIKTHDLVQSSSGADLTNHTVVTVKSAYETTLIMNGQTVPFWTVADSVSQLLDFFAANQAQANKITVDLSGVKNQLTGGIDVNSDGPVTVIADGKTSIAPNGKLTAASILDSKGIVVHKDDRVTVNKDGSATILQVQRVTHETQTTSEPIAFSTRVIEDPSLPEGTVEVRQQGQAGEKTVTYDVTLVDGVEESRKVTSEATVREPLDQIVVRGTAKPAATTNAQDSAADSKKSESGTDSDAKQAQQSQDAHQSTQEDSESKQHTDSSASADTKQEESKPQASESAKPQESQTQQPAQPTQKPQATQQPTQQPTQEPTQQPTQQPTQEPTQQPTQQPTPQPKPEEDAASKCRLYRPSAGQAQTYASGAAAQYGWTGDNWTALVKLWNRESGWTWSAENPWSGAYGIPQALPPSKMAAYGDWRNDGAAQIDWGLSYIAQQYGSPLKAWEHSEKVGWY
ncbi:G5 domain-containing protein [Bifidobacterium magnum]|uniref:G5 domain-containing protein n=1 Tax=Bifidobacterium magnum TaxID=1692 RepID=A0A087B9V6_9BIFI|nr:G5 domain-containing protein [Bifidobacterium magnum]KFI67806.1 G5 domain-containing protein [Bifidobacterium magnum]